MRNKFTIIGVVFFISVTEMNVLAGESAVQILNQNFKKIEVIGGNISITMTDSGRRYLFKTDGKDDDFNSRVLSYGEKVTLEKGFRKATFFNNGVALKILRLEGVEETYELQLNIDTSSSKENPVDIKTGFSINETSIEDVKPLPQKKDVVNSYPADNSLFHKINKDDRNNTSGLDAKSSTIPLNTGKPSGFFLLCIASLIAAGLVSLYIYVWRLKKKIKQ
jgi:hypothetical protein